MPEARLEPHRGALDVRPAAPVLPRVDAALVALSEAAERVGAPRITVLQRPPAGHDAASVAAKLAAATPDAVHVVWDVRGESAAAVAGSAFDGDAALVSELVRRLRDARHTDGRIVTDKLLQAIHVYTRARSLLVVAREQVRRDAIVVPEWLDARLVHDPSGQLSDAERLALHASLAALDVPAMALVLPYADADRLPRAPDGRLWVEHIRDRAQAASVEGGRFDRAATDGLLFIAVAEPVTVGKWQEGVRYFEGPSPEPLAEQLLGQATRYARSRALDRQSAHLRAQEQMLAAVYAGIGWALVAAFFVAFVVLLVLWRLMARASVARLAFFGARDALATQVEAAQVRVAELTLDADELAGLRALEQLGPVTRAGFHEAAADLDTLTLGVRVLARRVDAARATRPWLGRLRVGPWKRARLDLHAPVVAEAAPDEPGLFAPLDAQLDLPLEALLDSLTIAYEEARTGLARLRFALAARRRPLGEDLDLGAADALAAAREPAWLPSWAAIHPSRLRADELAALDALRRADPGAYLVALADWRATFDGFAEAIEALVASDAARVAAREATQAAMAHLPATHVDPGDAPAPVVATAMAADTVAETLLIEGVSFTATQAAVSEAHVAWAEALGRATAIHRAVAGADGQIAAAARALDDATAAVAQAEQRITALVAGHTGLAPLWALHAAASRDVDEGRVAHAAAVEALAAGRHLDAYRRAELAAREVAESHANLALLVDAATARQDAERVARDLWERLEADRVAHQRRIDAMGAHARDALAAGDALRSALVAPAPGPVDWVGWHRALHDVHAAWRDAVAAAQRKTDDIAAEEARRAKQTATSGGSGWSGASRAAESRSWSRSSSRSSTRSARSGGSSFRSSGGRSGGSSFRSSGGRSGGSRW